MRLLLLTTLTMVAFAANSVLNRLAVNQYAMDPAAFAVIRVASGVVVLWVLIRAQGLGWPGGNPLRRVGAAASLTLYMIGFSLAYLSLDTGVGALILFGGVQMTMFGGAALSGERVGLTRGMGALTALVGLAVLVWPSTDVSLPIEGIVLMAMAAIGWGIYSLMGRSEAVPLAATGANFVLCLPMVIPLVWLGTGETSLAGIALAIFAGGVTSGLGYALWYAVVPGLGAMRAGVAQLSVPLIAALGGLVVLDEALGWRFGAASVLVLGGIGLSLWRR